MSSSPKNPQSSSVYPWYYVPGNSSLTEKRLSTKYNKESRRYQQNEEIDHYYRKCNSEGKLFSNWQAGKPMVKYHRQIERDALSPFYKEDVNQQKIEEEMYMQCSEKMATLYKNYDHSSIEYKRNFIDCNTVIKYLFEYMKICKSVQGKRDFFLAEIMRNFKQCLYNSVRDPLRHVCFLVNETLFFYKMEIFKIIKLLKPVYKDNFLTELEQSELDQLNNRVFQIVDMYIQLNEIRNEHFQQMYDEEREQSWEKQKEVWIREISIWDNLIVKLLKSNYLLVKEKLENVLKIQRELFDNRMEKFELLNGYVNEVRQDHILQRILYKSIEQFKL